MDIDAPHAALLEQFGCRLDHNRRTSKIGLAAVELVEILTDRLMHEARSPRPIRSFAQDWCEMEVRMLLRQGSEVVVQVEVALGTDAEIEVDVLRQRLGEGALDDRL